MSTEVVILPPETPQSSIRLALSSAARTRNAGLTLVSLSLFGALGGMAKTHFVLMLPSSVLGLLLIAAALVITESRSQRLADRLHAASAPSARQLLEHMGLLFVPAGAGIVSEFATLRHAGVALAVGVVASTLVGIAVTYTAMRLLARRSDHAKTDGTHAGC